MRRLLATSMVFAALAGSTFAAPPRVIFSEIPTLASSDVPDVPGAKFTAFERIYGSPNGRNLVFSADTGLATTEDEVVLVKRGSSAWRTIAREGTPVPNGLAGENWGIFDQSMAINDAGATVGSNNTSAATTVDEVVYRQNADGSWVVPIREGDGVDGVAGATYGLTINSCQINSDGTANFLAVSLLGLPTTADTYCLLTDGSAFAVREGDAAAPLTDLWQFIDSDDFRTANDGLDYLVQGDTNNPSTAIDDVLFYNGAVVIQEGAILPGSGFTSNVLNVVEPFLGSNGDWFARGNNADMEDWLVRNGTVVVTTDDEVPGGIKGELFDDTSFTACFFLTVSNNNGDYAFGATTNNPNIDEDAVIVFVPGGNLANARVVLRQGDRVDLDGDGDALDDDARIDTFNNDDAVLRLDGKYIFSALIETTANIDLGQALMVVDLTVGIPGDMNCDGIVSVGDIAGFVLALTDENGYADANPTCDIENADVNADGVVSVGDIAGFVALLVGP